MKKVATIGAKPYFPPGSFTISSFTIAPGAASSSQLFRSKIPAGSRVVSAIATDDHKIAVYYEHDIPGGLTVNYDIVILREGEVIMPKSSEYRYDMIQSVVLDGAIHHLLHHYKVSRLILPN